MRLIDADRLIENIKGYSTIEGTKLSKADKKIIECFISHVEMLEPTVEAIPKSKLDEIVERLEEMEGKALRVQNYDVSFYATGQMHKAIEIVKGVMNERD